MRGLQNYAAFVWCASFIFITSLWILLDNRPPAWDQAYYLTGAERLYHILLNDGFISFVKETTTVLGRKAPFISIASVPLFLLFGSSYKSALLLNIVFFIIFSVFFFLLVKKLMNKATALLSLVIVSTTPLFYGLARNFFVEFVLMSVFIVWLFVFTVDEKLTNKKLNFYLGLTTGIGLLVKFHFFLFIISPLLLTYFVNFRKKHAAAVKPASLILIGTLILALPWYSKNIMTVLWHAKRATDPSLLGEYYYGNAFSFNVISKVFMDIVNFVISPYYFLLMIVLLIYILFKKKFFRMDYKIFLYLFVPFLVFFFGPNKDYRFMLPILPLFALILASILTRVVRSDFALSILFIAPIVFFIFNSFTLSEHNARIKIGPLIFTDDYVGYYIEKPIVGRFPNEDIVEFLSKEQTNSNNTAVLFSEDKFFNINNLIYISTAKQLPISFKTVSYNLTEEDALTEVKRANYALSRVGDFSKPASINKLNDYLMREITLGSWKKLDDEFLFPDGGKVLIYKNVQ